MPVCNWTVVIPVKGTPTAKSRLGASPDLALAIALDTVGEARGAAKVIVVTSAPLAPDFEIPGVRVILDAEAGLNAAARQGIAAAGDDPVAVLLGDLPALRSVELAAALELAAKHPLAFVADADNDGTVLITALDPARHAPAFGAHSRAAHLAAGYVELDIPVDSGLRRDVDTPDQLFALGDRVGRRTRAAMS
ncbi:MAG TPA: 2-phospho-L-lactate guanylyltransferase [Galbitalea sp.]|nr:2-phospho-L-lactate guanylyltransferase [Galbitalea sp.]